MHVKTNNVPRHLLYSYELTAKERAEFDYLTDEEIVNHSFVRYRGVVYDTGDFEPASISGWTGQHADSYFSAVVFRLGPDCESVVMGTAYC